MPGFVLEEGVLSGTTYRFDPKRLSADFPNLDYDEAGERPAVETITVSFLLSGTDGIGRRRFARQIVLQGDEVQMPRAATRRRAVR